MSFSFHWSSYFTWDIEKTVLFDLYFIPELFGLTDNSAI
jgi:hypothetical protein